MKVLGLTGGIGSGKTSVSLLFKEKGIPVFNSDIEAKKLYTTSNKVKQKVIALLGSNAYIDDVLNKEFVSNKIFSDKKLLSQINAIIHPEVKEKFNSWMLNQTAAFLVKESAILFESNIYKQCQAILTVTASLEIRIKRVMQRDQVSEFEVLNRVNNQWKEERKIELSDFVLYNNGDFRNLKSNFNKLYSEISFKMS